jgi:hypothetical protein
MPPGPLEAEGLENIGRPKGSPWGILGAGRDPLGSPGEVEVEFDCWFPHRGVYGRSCGVHWETLGFPWDPLEFPWVSLGGSLGPHEIA